MRKIITIITIILFTSPAFAQYDTANVFDIADTGAKEGDILIFSPEKGLTRTELPYDIHIFGVLHKEPVIVFQRIDGNGTPVIRTGVSRVNVTTYNGAIKKGDYITSSVTHGLGMKVTQSGHVLGVALEDFGEDQNCRPDPKSCEQGQIQVAIRIEYADVTNPRAANRLFEYIGTAFFRSSQDPEGFGQIIKYVVAGGINLATVIFGLFVVSRSISKAVEAIGRNPLAKRSIYLSVGLNIFIVLTIITFGIIASLIVLRL